MRDRQPQAFRRKRQTPDRRGYVERFVFGFAAANKGCLAGRPRHGAVGMQRDIVDPAPFWVGRQQRDLALGVERDELAVIAPHDDTGAVGSGAQDAAGMNGNL